MKNMKKIIAVLLVAVMAFSLAACGKKSEKKENDVKKYRIGICQLVQHPALDAATQGFKDALIAKLGADKVEFDSQNASGEATNCTTITSKFVSDKVDLIMANATDALAAAAEATDTIPVVATSITDYATALGMNNWTGKTGFNVTGTADLAPLDQQAAMFSELLPEAKKVAILYCSAEKNSKYQADIVIAELAKAGVTATVKTFVDSNDIIPVVQSIVDEKFDAVYIPTDNTAAKNTEAINNILEPAKIPVIAGEEGICKGCGIATLSISYYDLGYKTGEMAYEILVNGANPADMEVQYTPADKLTKKYMADRAEALGIKIPEGYEAIA